MQKKMAIDFSLTTIIVNTVLSCVLDEDLNDYHAENRMRMNYCLDLHLTADVTKTTTTYVHTH